MATYRTEVVGVGGPTSIDVEYRIRPWGVDLDEVYLAGTLTKVPLTAKEYYAIVKRITLQLQEDKHP